MHGLGQMGQCLGTLVCGDTCCGLFTQVVRQTPAEAALAIRFELLRNRPRVPNHASARSWPAGQTCLRLKPCAFQLEQRLFGTVQQAGLQIVQRQRMLSSVAVILCSGHRATQVLVHAHGTFVLAAAAKQIAQSEMQFRCVRVVLYGLDEGINRLVLLLIEQESSDP
jgi:hypothetical protein